MMELDNPATWARFTPYLDRAFDLESCERARWITELKVNTPDIAEELEVLFEEYADMLASGFLESSPAEWMRNR